MYIIVHASVNVHSYVHACSVHHCTCICKCTFICTCMHACTHAYVNTQRSSHNICSFVLVILMTDHCTRGCCSRTQLLREFTLQTLTTATECVYTADSVFFFFVCLCFEFCVLCFYLHGLERRWFFSGRPLGPSLE